MLQDYSGYIIVAYLIATDVGLFGPSFLRISFGPMFIFVSSVVQLLISLSQTSFSHSQLDVVGLGALGLQYVLRTLNVALYFHLLRYLPTSRLGPLFVVRTILTEMMHRIFLPYQAFQSRRLLLLLGIGLCFLYSTEDWSDALVSFLVSLISSVIYLIDCRFTQSVPFWTKQTTLSGLQVLSSVYLFVSNGVPSFNLTFDYHGLFYVSSVFLFALVHLHSNIFAVLGDTSFLNKEAVLWIGYASAVWIYETVTSEAKHINVLNVCGILISVVALGMLIKRGTDEITTKKQAIFKKKLTFTHILQLACLGLSCQVLLNLYGEWREDESGLAPWHDEQPVEIIETEYEPPPLPVEDELTEDWVTDASMASKDIPHRYKTQKNKITFMTYVNRPTFAFCDAVLSAAAHDVSLTVLGYRDDEDKRAEQMYGVLSTMNPDDFVVYHDQWVFYTMSSGDIAARLAYIDSPIVAAPEKNCWPYEDVDCNKYPFSPLPRWAYGPATAELSFDHDLGVPRFLNGELIGGRAGQLANLFFNLDANSTRSMHVQLAQAFLEFKYPIVLDYEMHVFQSMHRSKDDVYEDWYNDKPSYLNKVTGTRPGILSFNGNGRAVRDAWIGNMWWKKPGAIDLKAVKFHDVTGNHYMYESECSPLVVSYGDAMDTLNRYDFLNIGQTRDLFRILKQAWHTIYHETTPTALNLKFANRIVSVLQNSKALNWFTGDLDVHGLYNGYAGKGIVIPVHDKYFYMAYHAIITMRQIHNCTLPIYAMYNGDLDLSPKNRLKLKTLPSVQVLDLGEVITDEKIAFKGWSLKAAMLLGAPCSECILMDSDVWWLQTPERAFLQKQYLDSGALFYRDRTVPFPYIVDREWVYRHVPGSFHHFIDQHRIMKAESTHELESGMMVFNKMRNFVELLMITYLNSALITPESYHGFHGDKETFWLGMAMLETPYSIDNHDPLTFGHYAPKIDPERLCSAQMIHQDEDGKFFWVHGGVMKDKIDIFGEMQSFTHYVVETAHHEFPSNVVCTVLGTKFRPEEHADPTERRIVKATQKMWIDNLFVL
ncbi:mannosyltransferase putative-domain-containing protein [Gorgonomyces haynaldii]|nr:mannosyltransferase putative-domain-containing protein [Gorgonomyces haynaldii]